MSSPIPDELLPQSHLGEVDDPMQGSGQEDEEGEGDVLMPDATDSSEEGEDDEEQIRQVTEGFIVDEVEESEEEEAPRKRRKKSKRHHRGESPGSRLSECFLALTEMLYRGRNIGRR